MSTEKIERHNAHYRINPSGHRELVIKKKGKKDEETLNELSDELVRAYDEIAESMYFNPLPDGGLGGSSEQLQHQRRRNQPEAPGVAASSAEITREYGESPNNMTSSEPLMSDGPEDSRKKSGLKATARGNMPRNKYISGYKGDGIDYGATHNESFTGTGAIAIPPGVTTVGVSDDDTEDDDDDNSTLESLMRRSRIINEWEPTFSGGEYNPGDHKMVSPTGNGVASRSAKKERVGKYDTNTSKHGEAWPRKHNDTPAMCDVDEDGVENEPQGSHKSSVGQPEDGHTTKMGRNWPNKPKNSGSGVAEPFEGNRWSDGGTLSGGSGQSDPQEGWSPQHIGSLMESNEVDLQSLFNSYAKSTDYVCLEDFQSLLNAYGSDAVIDESSLVKLMEVNNELVFHEGLDASGRYWVGVPLNEGKKPWETDEDSEDSEDEDCEMDDSCDMTESRKQRKKPLNEYQIRSPEREAFSGLDEFGDDEFGDELDNDDEFGDDFGGMGDPDYDEDYDDMLGDAEQHDRMHGPGQFSSNNCPGCGAYNDSEDSCPECGMHLGGSEESVYGSSEDPGYQNVDYDDEFRYRGDEDDGMMYDDDFNFLESSSKMEKMGGKPIGGSSKPGNAISVDGNPGPDEMEDHGEPFGANQKNDLSGTPTMKGTGKGMSESKQLVKRNVAKLATHVKKHLVEHAKRNPKCTYAGFAVVVQEGRSLNRTPKRGTLAEALADAEEVLQIHSDRNVVLEAYLSKNGQIKKARIPITTVKRRGPLVSEGKALFRFRRTAENYADRLMNEGTICKIDRHNWGHSVRAVSRRGR